MNNIYQAEQEIQDYLFHEHSTLVNFVSRDPTGCNKITRVEYAVQCNTFDGTFSAMQKLADKLSINYTVFKDNGLRHCLILENPRDILTISNHIMEVEL